VEGIDLGGNDASGERHLLINSNCAVNASLQFCNLVMQSSQFRIVVPDVSFFCSGPCGRFGCTSCINPVRVRGQLHLRDAKLALELSPVLLHGVFVAVQHDVDFPQPGFCGSVIYLLQ
jgi:hypothetical protein